MSEEKTNNTKNDNMEDLLNDKSAKEMPKEGDMIEANVVSVGTNEVYVDIPGLTGGLIRGKEMVDMTGEFSNLKVGDKVSATVLDLENEKGLLELSFRSASEQKIWTKLNALKDSQEIIEVKINEANKGGLMADYNFVEGFLPVSQLSKENYPRVENGNKSKILEKLRELIGKKLSVNILDVDEEEEKIIFSEKKVYAQAKKEELNKYNEGDEVECVITGIVDFGVFVEFGKSLEGLIHISELAWQRIDHPKDLFKVGQKIKAQIIGIEGNRVTLSSKKLMEDPWQKAAEKYSVGQVVKGKVLKIDKFGVFVELDKDIHGLAHISELSDKKIDKVQDVVEVGKKYDFKILSIEPEDHRLGLRLV